MTGRSTNDFEISIIIPVYNEIELLPDFLIHLNEQRTKKLDIIVVDGGSTDGTWSFLKRWKDGTAIQTTKGRALQMNAGATRSHSEVLYFLHVDSRLPKAFDNLILTALSKGCDAGCFRLDFDKKQGLLHLAAFGSRWNHLWFRGGDQSLFVKKEVFTQLEGFDENYLVCEDLHLIRKLYQTGLFVVLQATLVTSSRKFLSLGVTKLLLHFRVLHVLHWTGVNAKYLWGYYQRFIK